MATQDVDDVIAQIVAHGIQLRSQLEPPDTSWHDTMLWGEEQGYFTPAENVSQSPVVMDLLILGLEAMATRWGAGDQAVKNVWTIQRDQGRATRTAPARRRAAQSQPPRAAARKPWRNPMDWPGGGTIA
jgi:hypothetical protein